MTDETPTLDSVLDAAMQLPPAHQQALMKIMAQRQIEMRREEIAAHAREAKTAYRTGALTMETANQLIDRLRATGEEAGDDE